MTENLRIDKITLGDREILKEALLLIERAFPECERRETEKTLKLLEKESYFLYAIKESGAFIGIISVWDIGFAFVEHFAIKEEYRCRGYGKEVIELIKKSYKRVVLEVEPPTQQLPKRRIEFYKRCGFFENPYDYLQPPYREGEDGVSLIIMSYPAPLSDFDGTVKSLYENVYNIKK